MNHKYYLDCLQACTVVNKRDVWPGDLIVGYMNNIGPILYARQGYCESSFFVISKRLIDNKSIEVTCTYSNKLENIRLYQENYLVLR